ncbi:MAG: OmpA family protein [Desulfosarcina sp.]|nr:OmpA family protein [Desulfobacterales bacterium]
MKTELILSAVLLIFLSACASAPPTTKKLSPAVRLALNTGGKPTRIRAATIAQDFKPADVIPAGMFVITDLPVRPVPPAKADRSVFSPKILKEKIKMALPEKTTNPTKQQKSERLTIYFDFDSYSIQQKEKERLNKFIKKFNQQPMRIDGYASPPGSDAHNRVLSLRRAMAVEKYLTKIGVKVATVVGHGENKAPRSKPSRKAVISIKRKE